MEDEKLTAFEKAQRKYIAKNKDKITANRKIYQEKTRQIVVSKETQEYIKKLASEKGITIVQMIDEIINKYIVYQEISE